MSLLVRLVDMRVAGREDRRGVRFHASGRDHLLPCTRKVNPLVEIPGSLLLANLGLALLLVLLVLGRRLQARQPGAVRLRRFTSGPDSPAIVAFEQLVDHVHRRLVEHLAARGAVDTSDRQRLNALAQRLASQQEPRLNGMELEAVAEAVLARIPAPP